MMATAAFNTASSEPYTKEQRLNRTAKQHETNMKIAAGIRELHVYALNTLFAHYDRKQDQMGDTAWIALDTLEKAFKLTQGLADSQVIFSQNELTEIVGVSDATQCG